MSLLQVKGLINKNIVNYVKSYQIVYDLISLIITIILLIGKAFLIK
jgi:hypothetical protein